MSWDELVQTSHTPKSRHRPLSSPKRQVWVLSAVVEVPASFLAVLVPNHFHYRTIWRTSFCHHDMRISVSLHCILEEFQSCSLVTLRRDIGLQNFAFVFDRPPRIWRSPLMLATPAYGWRRPHPDATAIAGFFASPLSVASWTCAESECRTDWPRDGCFRGKCRCRVHGEGLQHSEARAETGHTWVRQAEWSRAMF